ncbi:exopolysaccharide biosynthesis polyprenyl glycosylphosphotransferase [Sphingomonas sp. BGYR3]|uniref:exopolysaccharide biosynthesis polyprenyl glycosylphosphotransferase n=1 Tax=Sphingomonas sp. BGYR3 TaxID=2975483 RepID=UPI0021A69990|nr:exopolysaccharide biosynthesis polyprenyl glycosylphosphotransferase [Sphingomonas sp. BGYR3]MDG5489900.1 exopolysaccharide biosynthesis polyprenyl glycosylphosphotransferase [Sphingomonas sp. BGYR3]
MNLEAGRIATASKTPELNVRWRLGQKTARIRTIIGLVIVDIAAVMIAYFTAEQVSDFFDSGLDLVIGSRDFATGLVIAPIFLAVSANAGAYSVEIFSDRGGGIRRSVRALLLTMGIVAFMVFYLKIGDEVSRATFTIGSSLALLTLVALRVMYNRYVRRSIGPNIFSTVLISDGEQIPLTGQYSTYIAADSWLNPDNHCPIMFDRLARALRESDRVVVACSPERRSAWVKALKGANVRSEVVAPELAELQPLEISQWADTPTLVIAQGPLGPTDAFVKRTFDIVFSGLALIALSPIFIVLALLIKRESEGPVFFVQTRIGLGNRMFPMMKFRSMRVEKCDEDGARSTSRDDDRITRIGAFIRKTSLDELPQLINVLKGDMSIVGPRPHALGSRAADKLFWEVDDRYWQRHATKPGLTGLAQVRGFRGATEHERDLTDRLYADLEYLNDWSIWQDLIIIVKTFRVVVHRNAF